jgi:hypothetical protein
VIKSLIDAGPLIALFDKDDKYHMPAKTFLMEYTGELVTTWPVITEASHLLDFNINTQIDFLKWLHLEAVKIFHLTSNHFERLIELCRKYADLPMDIADGSLIIASEETGIRNIATIDSDYHVYRTKDKRALKNVLQPYFKTKHH